MQITSFLAGASAADFLNTQGYLLGSATAFVDQITNCIGTDQLDWLIADQSGYEFVTGSYVAVLMSAVIRHSVLEI